ncbi:CYTH and CHAD domain-containing protein [Streptacidiphilus neutrinimicus]|uniref:CYTH and CHAD domain-containing protein n=1 Tax=Streptacidiphilus neutrinimicus TaxID=105420 RepID=UPI0005A9AC1F|nr:CYTH and CHAD domain-containing protein [Streptacidiphilus neutrinimicus]
MPSNAHTEHEITFDGVPAGDLTATRPAAVARAEAGDTEILDAVYFDTPDHRLLRRGVTLRRRAGGHDAGWHLKLPGEHGGRREIGRPLRDGGTEEEIPQELSALACAYARGGPLEPVAHLLTHRRRVLWLDAKERPLAELAADHVAARVLDGAGTGTGTPAQPELSTWDETEVELVDGDAKLLDAAARKLTERGLHPADRGVKLARALRAAGLDVEPPRRTDVTGAGRTAEAVVAALRQHARRLIALDPDVRLDEPDAVHQMRVTARTLRSLLRACAPLFDTRRSDELAADLRWLGHELGGYRDPEALRERLVGQARELPADCGPRAAERKLRKLLDRRCRRAHRHLMTVMSSPRYFALLDRLEEFTADPPLRPGKRAGRGRAKSFLRHEARRTERRLRKALRQPVGEEQDEALHRARKAAKRTRYLAGALEPVVGAKAERLEARHKKIHKRLGAHQDARGAEQALGELARLDGTRPGEAFAFGVLRARQRDASPAHIAAARRAAGL